MSEPIKIIVTAETQAAAKALQDFVKQTGGGLSEVAKAGEKSAAGLNTSRMAMMELGHVGRATAEGLAAGISPLRILALESPRIIQAIATMGIGFATLAPYIIATGVAVGTGYLAWKAYMSGVEDTTKANEDLLKSLEKLPDLLNKINNLQKAGLISPAAAKEFADYLGKTPKKALYRHGDGSINESQNADEEQFYRTGDPFKDQTTHFVSVPGTQLTPSEAQDYVAKNKLPDVAGAQVEQANKYLELRRKITTESLAGAEKEIALVRQLGEAQRAALAESATGAGQLLGNKQLDEGTQKLLAESLANEQRKIAEIEAKAQDERKKKDDEWAKAYHEAQAETIRQNQENLTEEKRVSDEKERQLQLQEEIARTNAAVRLRTIQENPHLSDAEKQTQSIPAIQDLMKANDDTIKRRQDTVANTTDETARLEALRQISELKLQQVDLDRQLYDASHINSFSAQLEIVENHFRNMGTFAQQSAGIIQGTLTNVVEGLSSAFTSVIMGTKTAAQAFAQFGQQALSSLISMITSAVLYAYVALPVLTALGVLTGGATAAAGATTTTASVIAAQAAVMSASGFYEGGYTGNIGKHAVAGVVHGGEYVLDHETVNRVGLRNLEALHSGADHISADRSARGGMAVAAAGLAAVHVHFDEQAMHHHIEKSDALENWVVDIMSKNIHRFR